MAEVVNKVTIAADSRESFRSRERALVALEGLCHDRDVAHMALPTLNESQNVSRLLLLSSAGEGLNSAAYRLLRTASATQSPQERSTIAKCVAPELTALLCRHDTAPIEEIDDIVYILANLAASDICRDVLECEKGGFCGSDALLRLIGADQTVPCVQRNALRALTFLAERSSGRERIVGKGSVLPLVALCFVGSGYNEVRCHALRVIALLARNPSVRKVLASRGLLTKLSVLAFPVEGPPLCDPLLTTCIASVYSAFSVHRSFEGVDPSKTLCLFYSLLCSQYLDRALQGLWATANAVVCKEFRAEVIVSDGLKLVFAVLRAGAEEVQIWYEVARVIAGMAAGAHEDIEFLAREGAVEALVQIFTWCMEGRRGAVPDNEETEAQSHQEHLNATARLLCMGVCVEALRHLTALGYVCQLLCDLGGHRGVLHLLTEGSSVRSQEGAAWVVANLALHAGPAAVVLNNTEVIPTLVAILRESTGTAQQAAAAAAVANIATHSSNVHTVISNGGTAALLRMLKLTACEETVRVDCVRALLHLDTNEARFDVMQAGGLPFLLRYAAEGQAPLQTVCVKAVRLLAEVSDDAHRHAMVRAGVFSTLSTLLEADVAVVVVREAVQCISSLTRLVSNKVALLEQNALPILCHFLSDKDRDTQMHALTVLGNVANIPDTLRQLPPAGVVMRELCAAVQLRVFAVTLQACRCLALLTQYPHHAKAAFSALPTERYVELAQSANPNLQCYALQTLTNLAQHRSHWKRLHEAELTHTLATLLADSGHETALQTVRCLANIAEDPHAQETLLRETDVLQSLTALAHSASTALHTGELRMASTTVFTSERHAQMLQSVLAALAGFATVASGAEAIISYNCLPLFVGCLDCTDIEVRSASARCLDALSRNPAVRSAIEQVGGAHKMVATLQSSAALTTSLQGNLHSTSEVLMNDAKLKSDILELDDIVTDNLYGMPYEDRAELMSTMGSNLQIMQKNIALQTLCLQLLFNMAASTALQTALVESYPWSTFLQPLEVQDHHCQVAASRLAFLLLQVPSGLVTFIDAGGVCPLIRALEFEEDDVRELASVGVARLSRFDPKAFRAALLGEGGVSLLMEMLTSPAEKINARAYATVAALSADTELGEAFLSQGVLRAIRLHSEAKFAAEVQVDMITVVCSLAKNEKSCWRVLEKCGAFVLLSALTSCNTSVVRAGALSLCSLLHDGIDVAECYLRCPSSGAIAHCLETSGDASTLEAVLKVFACLAQKGVYREAVTKPGLVDVLLSLAENEARGVEMARRNEKVAGEGGGGDMGCRDSAEVWESVAGHALQALALLLPVSSVLEHLATEICLARLVACVSEKASVPRAVHSASVLLSVLSIPSTHPFCVQSGIVLRLASMCKVDNTECRTHVAHCLEIISMGASETTLEVLCSERVMRGVKVLLGSNLRAIRGAACTVLHTVLAKETKYAAKLNIVDELTAFVGADGALQTAVLHSMRLLFAELQTWLTSTVGTTKQNGHTQCEVCMTYVLALYRRSQQGSTLAAQTMYTLNCILAMSPEHFCTLLDAATMLDIKRAVTMKMKPKDVTPTIDFSRSNLDLQDLTASQGDFVNMDDADVRVQAAHILYYMSSTSAIRRAMLLQLLKAVSVDEMIKLSYTAFTEGDDPRYTGVLLKAACNCLQKVSQRHLLAEDRTGLLKQVYALTTHSNVLVVEPAAAILAAVSCEPLSHTRLLALCGIHAVTKVVLSFIEDGVTLAEGGVLPDFAAPITRTVVSLCKVLANLADGSPTAVRCVKETSDTLQQLAMALPAWLPVDCKLYIAATMATLDSTLPAPLTGISAGFRDLVEAAKDRLDVSRVQKGVTALCTLARDHRNHAELREVGALPVLCALLRSPVQAVFRAACWALCFLVAGPTGEPYELALKDKSVKERIVAAEKRAAVIAETVARTAEEGVAAAVKCALSKHNPEHARAASKLLVALLHEDSARKHLKQCGIGELQG